MGGDLSKNIAVSSNMREYFSNMQANIELCYSIAGEARKKGLDPEFEVEISLVKTQSLGENDESVAYFDPELVKFPIEVRSFKTGDRFSPLGMQSSKKLQDYFTDIKLPKFLRSRVPIFISDGEIMWAGGIRIDDRFKVTDKKGEVLKMKLVRPILT